MSSDRAADSESSSGSAPRSEGRALAVAYGRGLMGGMLVGVPVLMTMEMWWEGFFVPAWRLLLLYAVNFMVLLILQHYSGLTAKRTIRGYARAAVVASGLGIVAAVIVLFLLGVLRDDLRLRDFVGKVLLQSVPVSIGASVAMSEFGEGHRAAEERRKHVGYWGALGMALAGAMLFGFGTSGTEELLMLADQLTWFRAIGLMALSLVQVHAIVYAVDFKQRPHAVGTPRHVRDVMREGLSTYVLSLLVGGYLLWTFGTIGPDLGVVPTVYAVISIGFVTSLGAAAAELLI